MSHFIENTHELQSQPILQTISKEIVMPPIRNFKHCQSSTCQNENQQKLLKLMFYNIKNAQYEQIHLENAYEMRKQFQALKAKLVRKSQYETVQQAMENKPRLPKLQLSEIIKMNPVKIDLLKKHRGKIHGKLSLYRQAEGILKEKTEYHQWYDSTKNCPINSPIFTKMAYLLQKLNRKDMENGYALLNRSNIEKSQSKKNALRLQNSSKRLKSFKPIL